MYKNSIIESSDNSGAIRLRVIQKYQYRTNPIGVKAAVVMRKFDPTKKLFKKRKYACLFVTSRQTVRRQNGLRVRFGANRGILFYDKDYDRLLGTRVFGPVGRELRKIKIEAAALQKIAANCLFV